MSLFRSTRIHTAQTSLLSHEAKCAPDWSTRKQNDSGKQALTEISRLVMLHKQIQKIDKNEICNQILKAIKGGVIFYQIYAKFDDQSTKKLFADVTTSILLDEKNEVENSISVFKFEALDSLIGCPDILVTKEVIQKFVNHIPRWMNALAHSRDATHIPLARILDNFKHSGQSDAINAIHLFLDDENNEVDQEVCLYKMHAIAHMFNDRDHTITHLVSLLNKVLKPETVITPKQIRDDYLCYMSMGRCGFEANYSLANQVIDAFVADITFSNKQAVEFKQQYYLDKVDDLLKSLSTKPETKAHVQYSSAKWRAGVIDEIAEHATKYFALGGAKVILFDKCKYKLNDKAQQVIDKINAAEKAENERIDALKNMNLLGW